MNFMGIEEDEFSSYASSQVALQLAPYEHTSSYGQGSIQGPSAILKASHFVEFYDEELEKETYKHIGIATQEILELGERVDAEAMDFIESNTAEHLSENKFVMTFGAEHTITLGVFKAFKQKYPNISILQIDAHSDLRPSYEGNAFSHASIMARINEYRPQIAQVGIRAQCKEEAEMIRASEHIQCHYAHEIRGDTNYISRVLEHLTETVYITIDADGLDPSEVPAVGTPEPGGMRYYEVLDLLKAVCSYKKVVGFDIVECAPIHGQNRSEYLLAQLAYKVLGYCTLNVENFTYK